VAGRYSPAPDNNLRFLVAKRPVGPCYLVTPWNFPLAMATRKVGPALAAGCTCVVKPARLTPLTTLLFAEILQQAGLPDGVVNVLPTAHTAAVTDPLIADPRLRKLSFTGSTPVGKQLIAAASENVLRVSMELGGNAPFLVFEDADLDKAVDAALAAKFRNGGEACTAANRFFVQESVAEEFTSRIAARVESMKVGHGTEPGVDVGPLIDAAAVDKCRELVDDAVSRGAKVLVGGREVSGPGHFFEPTVLADVPREAKIVAEEIFGPVLAISTFTTESEAVERANATEYGLASYVMTESVDRVHRMVDALDYGLMGVNVGVMSNAAAPFGGVKQSGMGREGSFEGIEEYLSVKYTLIPG
jgi:succinate-semialdehyde dehydrogenase/glutarate-semialdehyde dehydrogenase